MDGAFICYHNTQETFGFEYIKTTEIERRIFGSTQYADVVFVTCSKLLVTLMNHILQVVEGEKFEQLKLGFYADSMLKKMTVFVELMPEATKWSEKNKLDLGEDIKDEFDYYTKHTKLTNKVLKFDFFVNTFINGVQ